MMPKCSKSILIPIKTRTIPPAISAFALNFAPNLLPVRTPAKERTKVVAPIRPTEGRIDTLRKAKVIPTASASMLVAIARTKSSLIFSLYSSVPSSFSFMASNIIFPPMKHKSPKAIQWSKAVMYFSKLLHASQPTKGMTAWNTPKKRDITSPLFIFSFLMESPLHKATAKASMERPIAIKSNSIKVMLELYNKNIYNFNMAFDGSVVACITRELNNTVAGGRIIKISQPEKNQLLLAIKKGGNQCRLFISAEAQLPVIYLTEKNLQSPAQAPAFCMLLRKHLINSRIVSVFQPSLERIINIEIEHFNEMGDLCRKTLAVEMMGKHSNIIFLDGNRIIDSIKHVSALVSSVREVLPGREYFIPFSDDKYDPFAITKPDFFKLFKDSAFPAAKTIYGNITGISPQLSEEILYLSGLDSDIPGKDLDAFDREAVYKQFCLIMDKIKSGSFKPNIVYENGQPFSFVPFEFSIYKDLKKEYYGSISCLLYEYYAKKQALASVRQKTQDLRQVILNLLHKDYKKYDLQLKQIKDTEKKDKYRMYGELLTAYGYNVPPKSTTFATTDYNTGEEITIPLDPALSAIENGKKYFDKYSKMRRTAEALSEIVNRTKDEIEHLESISVSLDMVKNADDIADLKKEMVESGYMKDKSPALKKGRMPKSAKNAGMEKRSVKGSPLHFVSSDGYDIYVGKNNLQNEYISFKLADGNDWWFHAKKIPGSHVIVKTKGGEIPDRTFEEAASLAAHFSKANPKAENPADIKVEIDYIRCRFLKKTPGGKPGFVIYHKNYSLFASADISEIREAD